MKGIFIIMMMVATVYTAKAQTTLSDILSIIQKEHPQLKMYDADIRSMDEAAKGSLVQAFG